MLTKLTLQDFQKHHKLAINLDPLCTTIVGPSDRGKSSVVRSLRWLALNRPSGDAFIRWGTSKAKVELEADGHRISRSKGKGIGTYRLDGQPFKAFGTGVPEAIVSLLNVSEINIQGQLDGPWLFDRSPGEVSREFNAIINLGLIDRTLARIGQELRRSKASKEVCRERLDASRTNRDALAWVVEADEGLMRAEGAKVRLEQSTNYHALLIDLLQQAKRYGEEHQNASEASVDAANVLQKGTEAAKLAEKTEKLRKITFSLAEVSKTSKTKAPLAELMALGERAVSCQKQTDTLTALLSRIETKSREALEARASATQLSTKIRGQRCPTCLRPM